MKHIRNRPYIIPILGLVLGLGIVAAIWVSRSSGETFRPSDAHVVFLFDGDERHVLDTRAQNVGELVSRLNLKLIDQDVIEPTLDTPIVEDNFRINVYRARPVTVVDGESRTVTLTAQRSPRVVAEDAGLDVHAEDIAAFQRGNLNENILGEQVVVTRAAPIKLNLYGTQVNTYTLGKTVQDMLVEKKIKLDNGETVSPALTTPIKSKMQIFILAKGAKLVSVEEEIAFPTKKVGDASLSFGTTVTRQKGKPGKQLVTYLITTQKNKEPQRKIIQQANIDPPVPEIVAVGTAINVSSAKQALMAKVGIRSSDYAYVNYIISRESGWCPTKWQGEYGTCPAYHGVPSSGGYGLCQSTPPGKMASAGSDWQTNPVTQLRWCDGYAQSRHGGWAGAYNFWVSNHYW